MFLPGIETFLLRWLFDGRRLHADSDNNHGRYVLSYSRRYRWTLLAFTAMCVGLLVLGAFSGEESRQLLAVYYALFIPICGLFFYAAYDAFVLGISFDEQGVFIEGAQTRFVPWTAVTGVRYVRWLDWFVVECEGGVKIRLSAYRDGLHTFAQLASRGMQAHVAGKAGPLLIEKAARTAVHA